jgi:hypothetical protein
MVKQAAKKYSSGLLPGWSKLFKKNPGAFLFPGKNIVL